METKKALGKSFDKLQLKIIYYLRSGLRPRMPKHIRNKILDWFKNYDDDWFSPKNIKKVQKMMKKESKKPVSKIDGDSIPYTLESARTLIDLELKGRDIEAEWKAVNARLDLVFDIFDIPQNIREPLRFISHHAMDKNALGSVWYTFTTHGSYDIGYGDEKALASIANCKQSQVDDCLDPEGPCFEKGILYCDDESDIDITLTKKFRTILGGEYKNRKEILDFILKSKLTAVLVSDDFKHISEIYDHAKNLLKNAILKEVPGVNILLYGKAGTGKTEMAKTLAADIGAILYAVAEGKDCRTKDNRLAELMMTQSLVGNKSDTVLLFNEAEDIFFDGYANGKDANSKQSINKLLESNKVPIIWTTNNIYDMDSAHIRRFTYPVEIPKPNEDAKKKIWQNISAKIDFKISDKDIAEFAERYDTTPSNIETALKSAKLIGDEKAIKRALESLIEATEGQVHKNENFGVKNFNPLLLNTDMNLEELANRVIQLKKTNFSILLHGVPGTGKSVYARYLADKMKLPVIEKRASDLLNKYVGETEQLIAGAFRAAKHKKAMLVIDEVENFLRDRTGATRSWETSMVNEMLTHMERNEYPLVCTTNLTDVIDAAAFRRFNFKVKYGYMKPEQVRLAFKHFFNQDIPGGGISKVFII